MEDLLEDILKELKKMNKKLDDIQGSGLYDSIADICSKLDDIERNMD